MNSSVFIDTNYWIAIFNPEDQLQLPAVKLSRKINAAGARLYTSNYVLAECFTVISQKCGNAACLAFKDYLVSSDTLQIVWINQWLDDKVWQTFKAVQSKNISYVDASNITVVMDYGLDYLLTFDENLIKVAKKNKIECFI